MISKFLTTEVLQSWSASDIPSGVTERAVGLEGERGRVDPVVRSLVGRNQIHTCDAIGAIVELARAADVLRVSDREGPPALEHQDPVDSPAVQELTGDTGEVGLR